MDWGRPNRPLIAAEGNAGKGAGRNPGKAPCESSSGAFGAAAFGTKAAPRRTGGDVARKSGYRVQRLLSTNAVSCDFELGALLGGRHQLGYCQQTPSIATSTVRPPSARVPCRP